MKHYDLLLRIAGGDLSPHLAKDEKVSPIYYYWTAYGEFYHDDHVYFNNGNKNFLLEYPGWVKDDFSPRKHLNKASGEIWLYPTNKAYCYYELIDAEKVKIISHYYSIYNETRSQNEADFLVNKEIHALSTLAKNLQEYTLEQIEGMDGFDTGNSNHYVICLLRETIIDLFIEINNFFEGLIPLKKKNPERLRAEYFGVKPFELKNLVIDDKTTYLLHIHILKSIWDEFNDEVFHCHSKNDFCEIFATNDIQSFPFEIKQKSRFYYLLDVMWEKKEDIDSKISSSYPTKESFVKPFLERNGGNFKVFGNQTVKRSTNKDDKVFKKKVDAIFK